MSKTESSDASAGQDSRLEQQTAIVAEKHPNLTLLESGQNPGEILRAAREKAGYSLSDISAQTKINEKQLEAIESGDVSRLPPETFAKAFIKSYCKALKIDATPIILSFGFSEGSAQQKMARSGQGDAARVEPFEPKMPSSSKRLSSLNFDRKSGKKSLSYGIVLAALALMAVFYIPVFMSSQDAEVAETDVIEPNEAPATALEAPAAQQSANGASLPLALDAPAAAVESPIFPALQQPAQTEPAPAVPAPSAPAATAPLAAAPAAPTVAPPAAPAATTPPAATVAAQAAVAPAAGAQGVLRFNFQEQSWVTVRDANDQVLISQLNDSGSNLEVRGQGPFKLIVGNAKSVTVSSNGKPVDLSASIRGEVARVTVQ